MTELQLGRTTADQPIPPFIITIEHGWESIDSPVIVDTPGTQIALDDEGHLVHNGIVVSPSLSINSWYTPFITYDGHLRVRREDGQLEPYMGPDALIEEVPVQVCGREESGVAGSACILPVTHGDPALHQAADGRYWREAPAVLTNTCKAALVIKGEHFPCDWPANAEGEHDGWNHSSKAAEAVWSN